MRFIKHIGIVALTLLMAVAANAAEHVGTVLHTSCGKEVMTVAPECFENSSEYFSYLTELNDTYCGELTGWNSESRYK